MADDVPNIDKGYTPSPQPLYIPPDTSKLLEKQNAIIFRDDSLIEKSIQDAVEVVYQYGLPLLPPPSLLKLAEAPMYENSTVRGMSLEDAALYFRGRIDEQQHEIISDMLDNWSKSIKAEQERSLEKLKEDLINHNPRDEVEKLVQKEHGRWDLVAERLIDKSDNSESTAKLSGLLSDYRSLTMTAKAVDRYQDRLDEIEANHHHSHNSGYSGQDPLAEEMTVISPMMVGGLVIVASMELVALSGSRNEWSELTPVQEVAKRAHSAFPDDFRDELSMIGAWFAGMAQYTAIATVIISMESDKEAKFDEKAFAKSYADHILKMVNSGDFNQQVSLFLASKTEKGAPLTPERQAELTALLKLTLIVLALGVVHKAELKDFSAEEFEALLKGEVKLPHDDVRLPLLQEVKTLLRSGAIPKEKAAEWLQELIDHVVTNNDLKKLGNPLEIFARGRSADASKEGKVEPRV